MTDPRYDMRPIGRVDYETVDEMGLEAVLALKRERDALRAEVDELKATVARCREQFYDHNEANAQKIEALQAQVRNLLDPLVRARALQPVTMTLVVSPEEFERISRPG